jgi:hypothetical protein
MAAVVDSAQQGWVSERLAGRPEAAVFSAMALADLRNGVNEF